MCACIIHRGFRRGEARRGAPRPFGLFGRTYPRFSVARATTFTQLPTRKRAYVCVCDGNTVAQFARLRHGRLVNSAARNQTPRTLVHSYIARGIDNPPPISLLEIAGWRIRARRFSRGSSLQFFLFLRR